MKTNKFIESENSFKDDTQLDIEVCMNPWNGVCKKTEILLSICHDGQTLPICKECWNNIAFSNLEWRYD